MGFGSVSFDRGNQNSLFAASSDRQNAVGGNGRDRFPPFVIHVVFRLLSYLGRDNGGNDCPSLHSISRRALRCSEFAQIHSAIISTTPWSACS